MSPPPSQPMLLISPSTIALGCFLFLAYYYTQSSRKQLPSPPGPHRLPLIGNLLDIPKTSPWLVYRDLGEKLGRSSLWTRCVVCTFSLTIRYVGKIISLYVLGRTVVVINEFDTAMQLLDRRSSTYASRPDFKMAQLSVEF